jgi:hypothetical protein
MSEAEKKGRVRQDIMYFEEWIPAYPPCRMADSTNNVHGTLIIAWKHEVQPALGFFHVDP